MTVTAITLTITIAMTALNTAAIEYTMGEYGVDDNNEGVAVTVFMVEIRPVKQKQSYVVSQKL